MQWENLTGPPVLTGLPDLGWPAKATALTWLSAPRNKPSQGGRSRGGEAERHEASDHKVIRTGSDRDAKRVATPAKVIDKVTSSVKSKVGGDKDAMEQLAHSMRRMGLLSPKLTPLRGGNELLQPPRLDLEDEVESRAPDGGQSKSQSRVHGEVGHDGENFRHYHPAKDSGRSHPSAAKHQKGGLHDAIDRGADQVVQRKDRNCDYLCQLEASVDLFAVPAERVWVWG